MTQAKAKWLIRIRHWTQFFFLFLFFFLLVQAGRSVTEKFTFTDSFFYIDPLLFLINFIASQKIIVYFLISLIPIFLTFIFGRFFCGWICPLGSIHHFFTWTAQKLKKGKKTEPVQKPMLKLKYILLIVLVVMAIMGTHVTGWFDPFSQLTRTASVVINPSVNYSLNQILKPGAGDSGFYAKALKPFYRFSQINIVTEKQRLYRQTFFIGLIFLILIMFNLFRRRFYCNYVCPLGALYGLLARFSIFNLKTLEKCKKCNLCSSHCTYNGSPYQDYLKSECLVCFNCVKDCPHQAIAVKFALPGKTTITPVDLKRRKVMGSIASGVLLASLPRIAPADSARTHAFVRPPGSIAEKEFLKKCIRCGQCMQVCPTNFIQPAFFQTGADGIWTPVLNPKIGYCEYECRRCSQVCPTQAIEKLTLADKKVFKIGTAVIDRNRCYTYADGYDCAVCEEHCPVPEKAIHFRQVEVWNFEGQLVKVNQIYVMPERCIGCGVCEHKCPRTDSPGIFLTSEEEQRHQYY